MYSFKPLISLVKMPVPDRRLPIKEENIPNLKNLLLKSTRRESEEMK